LGKPASDAAFSPVNTKFRETLPDLVTPLRIYLGRSVIAENQTA
jgi:hypothetical protein